MFYDGWASQGRSVYHSVTEVVTLQQKVYRQHTVELVVVSSGIQGTSDHLQLITVQQQTTLL